MARQVLRGVPHGPGDPGRPTRRRLIGLIEAASNMEEIKEILHLMVNTQMEAPGGLTRGGV